MKHLKIHNCPACHSKIVGSPVISPEIDLSLERNIEKKMWLATSKKRTFFPYYRCKCGMLTTKIFINEKALKHLYSNMKDNVYKDDNKHNDIKTKKNYLSQIEIILDSRKKKLKVLEVGADNGNFLKLIKEFNDNINFTIVEPNKNMHKKLKLLTKNVYKDIKQIPRTEKFDLVIAIHVFDHIPNLIDFLKKIGTKLKKGGSIYGVVHDEKSVMAKILGNRWQPYSPQHPHLFNPNSINYLFKSLNYDKSFITKTINFFNIGFLLQNLFAVIFKIKINFPSFFPIGLKLGNFSFLYKKQN
jgi:2-polyprenyl-3-methyl-5-hydroxy-6-metoxy-1,4-benzoquinol methylase